MTLKDWLALRNMSDAEFARLSGIGQRALVQKYRHGRQFPSIEKLRLILEATDGAVTANDFYQQQASALPQTVLPTPIAPKPRAKRAAAAPALDPPPPASESSARPRRRAA